MTGFCFPPSLRGALLAGAAWCAFAAPALAGDLPATPAGATALTEVFKTYFGAAPTVAPQGSGYNVNIDFTPPAALFGGANVKIEPVKVAFMLFAQDDGGWRVEQKDLPQMAWKSTIDNDEISETVNFNGFRQVAVYDPKIAGLRSGAFSADKVSIAAIIPNGKEDIEVTGMKGTATGAAGPDGALTAEVKQTFDGFNLKLVTEPKAKGGAPQDPVSFTGRGSAITSDAKVDGLKSHALLDVWAFMVAHPQRADLAANEAPFKALLTTAAAGNPSASNSFEGSGIVFESTKGSVGIDKAAGGVSVGVKGPQSHFEEHFSFSGLSLPPAVVPAAYKDLVPTAVDIGVKLSNFDLNAAAQEAIADIKLAGDGPWIGKDEHDKMMAKLMGDGPLVIEITGSHIVGPVIDLTLDGRAEYRSGGKPVGKLTLRMRNFDKTVAALKALGEDAQSKIVPMLAMAKGLGKVDGDALVWVCEIGADRVMKVNGLPLGKAPI